jgi:Flp pilus assembly protein protease CpaA
MNINLQLSFVFAVWTLAVLLIAAVAIESRTGRVPNWLNLLGILAGIGLAAADGLWSYHVGGLLLGLTLGIVLFVCSAAGGGFAKLLTAVGAIGGPVIPTMAVVLSAGAIAYSYGVLRNSAPRVTEGEAGAEQDPSWTLMRGSLLASAGAVAGVALLIAPW